MLIQEIRTLIESSEALSGKPELKTQFLALLEELPAYELKNLKDTLLAQKSEAHELLVKIQKTVEYAKMKATSIEKKADLIVRSGRETKADSDAKRQADQLLRDF